MTTLEDLKKTLLQFWLSLANVNLVGQNNPTDFQNVMPVPQLAAYQWAADDGDARPKLYTPLNGSGKIHGTLMLPNANGVATGLTNGGARTAIGQAGDKIYFHMFEETGGANPITLVILTADAAPTDANTLYSTGSMVASGTQKGDIPSPFVGPVYVTGSAGAGTGKATYSIFQQTEMT